MIHTLTMNPGIDLSLELNELLLGEVQRPTLATEQAGGKGMNVARALTRLQVPAKAWVLVGGPMGEKWESIASQTETPFEAVTMTGETRQNIKIFETGFGRQTDLNLPGPEFDAAAFDHLLSGLVREVKENDTVVVAGSSLPSTPMEAWMRLGKIVRGNNARLAMDTTGEVLNHLDKVQPWLVKLNLDEFNDWRKTDYRSLEDLEDDVGALPRGPHFIVTDGPEGALAASSGGDCERTGTYRVEVRGTVGAGDAFTAGFLCAWEEKEGGWRNALAWGAAVAAGAVELPGTAFPTRERVLELLLSEPGLQETELP